MSKIFYYFRTKRQDPNAVSRFNLVLEGPGWSGVYCIVAADGTIKMFKSPFPELDNDPSKKYWPYVGEDHHPLPPVRASDFSFERDPLAQRRVGGSLGVPVAKWGDDRKQQ